MFLLKCQFVRTSGGELPKVEPRVRAQLILKELGIAMR